jgi:hypothetical protein
MVPMSIKRYVSKAVAISLLIHLVVHMLKLVVNCETWKLAFHKLINGKLWVFLMYMYSWDTKI